MHDASIRRIDLYKAKVLETLEFVEYIADEQLKELSFWSETRTIYADLVRGMTNFEIAETFYNSIYNAVFEHRRIRDEHAFVFSPQGDMPPVDVSKVVRRFRSERSVETAVLELLNYFALSIPYANIDHDVENIVRALRQALPKTFDLDSPYFEFQVLEHHF